jgi:hypothetical protein|tara:strand:+ start:1110 stop:1514 length:405 start_codon:yes stop_codon:yes gene_type:complete
MATTTAKIALASADLISDILNLNITSTLTQAGVSTGLSQSTGVGRKTTLDTAQYTLFAKGEGADNTAHKVYLHNTSTTAAQYCIISIESTPIGRLYAGDWCLIPWDGLGDIKITPSVATIFTVEHSVFLDNPTS